MQEFFVEVTDTFGGEANYTRCHRYVVQASSFMGAIRKVAKHCGYSGRIKKVMATGDMTRHDVRDAAICIFTLYADEYNTQYAHTKL